MDKSENLSKKHEISKDEQKNREIITTDHNYTHTFKWAIPTGI